VNKKSEKKNTNGWADEEVHWCQPIYYGEIKKNLNAERRRINMSVNLTCGSR
jgi:hypothetical protein